MLIGGIDVGAAFVKMVVMEDGKVVTKGIVKATLEQEEDIRKVIEETLQTANIKENQIKKLGSTGVGRNLVKGADVYVTDVTADAAGVHFLNREVKTVIDIGGEESRAIKVGSDGTVVNFAVNDKCAAGAGAFVEAMARAMQLTIEEFAEASLKSTQKIPINAQCAIFAESEVVSLVSDEVPREDICRAVHDGISERISSMAKRVMIEEPVGVIGGAAHNKGLIASLNEALGLNTIVFPDPEYVSAIGAALLASRSE